MVFLVNIIVWNKWFAYVALEELLADIEITLTCNEASWKKCKKKKNSLLQERRRLKLNKRASEAKIGKVAVIKCVKDTENLESSLMYILEEMTNWQN